MYTYQPIDEVEPKSNELAAEPIRIEDQVRIMLGSHCTCVVPFARSDD